MNLILEKGFYSQPYNEPKPALGFLIPALNPDLVFRV